MAAAAAAAAALWRGAYVRANAFQHYSSREVVRQIKNRSREIGFPISAECVATLQADAHIDLQREHFATHCSGGALLFSAHYAKRSVCVCARVKSSRPAVRHTQSGQPNYEVVNHFAEQPPYAATHDATTTRRHHFHFRPSENATSVVCWRAHNP